MAYRQHFGCCSDLPESVLHTGDRWDYPKWYINYLRGVGEQRLPSSARILLEAVSDNNWHKELPERVGVGTIEACQELELLRHRPYERVGRGYRAEFCITDRGRKVLREKKLPD